MAFRIQYEIIFFILSFFFLILINYILKESYEIKNISDLSYLSETYFSVTNVFVVKFHTEYHTISLSIS